MSSAARRVSILYVEDDPLVRHFVIEALADEGYRAETAASADEARAKLDGQRFDVLMTDILLPRGQDGFALAAWAASRCPGMRIIYTSGLPEDGDPRMTARGSFLEKPFGACRLLRSIEAATAA